MRRIKLFRKQSLFDDLDFKCLSCLAGGDSRDSIADRGAHLGMWVLNDWSDTQGALSLVLKIGFTGCGTELSAFRGSKDHYSQSSLVGWVIPLKENRLWYCRWSTAVLHWEKLGLTRTQPGGSKDLVGRRGHISGILILDIYITIHNSSQDYSYEVAME